MAKTPIKGLRRLNMEPNTAGYAQGLAANSPPAASTPAESPASGFAAIEAPRIDEQKTPPLDMGNFSPEPLNAEDGPRGSTHTVHVGPRERSTDDPRGRVHVTKSQSEAVHVPVENRVHVNGPRDLDGPRERVHVGPREFWPGDLQVLQWFRDHHAKKPGSPVKQKDVAIALNRFTFQDPTEPDIRSIEAALYRLKEAALIEKTHDSRPGVGGMKVSITEAGINLLSMGATQAAIASYKHVPAQKKRRSTRGLDGPRGSIQNGPRGSTNHHHQSSSKMINEALAELDLVSEHELRQIGIAPEAIRDMIENHATGTIIPKLLAINAVHAVANVQMGHIKPPDAGSNWFQFVVGCSSAWEKQIGLENEALGWLRARQAQVKIQSVVKALKSNKPPSPTDQNNKLKDALNTWAPTVDGQAWLNKIRQEISQSPFADRYQPGSTDEQEFILSRFKAKLANELNAPV